MVLIRLLLWLIILHLALIILRWEAILLFISGLWLIALRINNIMRPMYRILLDEDGAVATHDCSDKKEIKELLYFTL